MVGCETLYPNPKPNELGRLFGHRILTFDEEKGRKDSPIVKRPIRINKKPEPVALIDIIACASLDREF